MKIGWKIHPSHHRINCQKNRSKPAYGEFKYQDFATLSFRQCQPISCRPILIDLKEIKKLTLPLIRGLLRLLVLLSSMFNKSLGEKILAHLYLFTDKPKIIELQLSKVGEEPKLIASMIDLFPLIPQASRFVEVLIKVTLR